MRVILTISLLISFCAGIAAAQVPSSPVAAPATLPDGLRLPVELKHSVNTKKAAAGQPVAVVLLNNLRNGSGTIVIPKGALLTGRIADATARTKENAARLAILIERAEWQGGSIPLHAYVESGVKVQVADESGVAARGRDRVEEGNFGHPRGGDVTLGPLTSPWDDVEFKSLDGIPEMICKRHNIELPDGTRLIVRQVAK